MAVGHHHHEGDIDCDAPPRAHRLLLLAVAPFVIATLVGLVVLWPSARPPGASALALGFDTDLVDATVRAERLQPCAGTEEADAIDCASYDVRLDEGPDEGSMIAIELQDSPTTVHLDVGDGIVLARATDDDVPEDLRYSFADLQRQRPLLALGLLFVVAVVALGRVRGLAALAGLALSLAVLVKFVLPSILDGNNAVAVSLVGASVIMLAALYLAHGFNDRTTTAVLGTLVSLALTAGLAVLFIGFSALTGLADEDARILQISSGDIDLRGLVLGGVIIGTLGVLDDVTVTQVSAVWELHQANPTMGVRRLYAAALRIGRDHIASTVNTLVLAYAGASLPLLILFVEVQRGLGDVLTGETVATEVVRTLVGSIGLVAAVPITTFLAAVVTTGWDSPTAAD
jgi:uncharacterized membrane protein